MKKHTYLTLAILLLLLSCRQDDKPATKEAIGILHVGLKKLIIAEGKKEQVLDMNKARQQDGAAYQVPIDAEGRKDTVTVNVFVVDNLQGYLDLLMAEPSFYSEVYYENAKCSDPHPAFTSDCEPTFDEHAPFGRAMIWSVEPWSSCVNGKSTCTEKWRSVGTIEYFDQVDCSDTDTTNVQRPIMRFRCDNG
jgi:hypothetical protein